MGNNHESSELHQRVPYGRVGQSGWDQKLIAVSEEKTALQRRERERIAVARFRSLERVGRELDNGKRAQRESQAPGRDGAADAHDLAIPRDEDDVDRKAHEEGMDAVAGRDDERGVDRQRRAAEQTFPPRRRFECAFERRRDDKVGAVVAQDPAILRPPQQRIEKGRD